MKFAVILCAVLFIGIDSLPQDALNNQLTEIFYWDILDFEIPSNRREQALTSGSYIPSKNGILSLGIWQDKLFLGIFRVSKGVLSSLNYISLNGTEISPVLRPYPSFEANYINEDPANRTVTLPNSNSVINTAHFYIDQMCDRLWLVDSGYTDHFGTRRSISPPAIVIFDLTTDTLIRRFEIPKEFINPLTTLVDIEVDFGSDSCDDVHAYVPDFFRSIIVYSFKKDRAWQVEHHFMGSDPHEGNFAYAHLNFQWNYGVYALVIGDKQPDGSKRVYFSPLTSTKIYYVSNQVLQDENYTMSNYYDDFHLLGETGKGNHASQMVYDETTGSMFNTMFGGATIGCWNVRLPFQSVSKVHKLGIEFYPVGVHIDANRDLWTLSHILPFTMYEEFQVGKKNVRIFKQPVDMSITGTNCQLQHRKSEI